MKKKTGFGFTGVVAVAVLLLGQGLARAEEKATAQAAPSPEKNESNLARGDITIDYPVAAGAVAQNFTSNVGFSSTVHLSPLIEPWLSNYLSVGYASFSLSSDSNSSFRVIPVLAGVGLPGKISEDLSTELGAGVGGAIAYLNAPGSTSYRAYGYFLGQLRATVEYKIASGFSVLFRVPVNFVVGKTSMTYLAYTVGAAIHF
ncbi:MAG: hypothetical protein EBX52_09560, partial [Proteobacteria bacterium]|nr:hypothetical protein [Pseudomonadota bacterium]